MFEIQKLAVRIGLTIEQYWEMTPREFRAYLESYQEKQLEEMNKNIILAWHIEVMHRQKKLEKVEKYLIKENPKTKSKSNNTTKNEMSKAEMKNLAEKRGLKHPWR